MLPYYSTYDIKKSTLGFVIDNILHCKERQIHMMLNLMGKVLYTRCGLEWYDQATDNKLEVKYVIYELMSAFFYIECAPIMYDIEFTYSISTREDRRRDITNLKYAIENNNIESLDFLYNGELYCYDYIGFDDDDDNVWYRVEDTRRIRLDRNKHDKEYMYMLIDHYKEAYIDGSAYFFIFEY